MRVKCVIVFFLSLKVLTGCGVQPTYWYASEEYLTSSYASLKAVPFPLELRTENLNGTVSVPSLDSRRPFATFEYEPEDVIRTAWFHLQGSRLRPDASEHTCAIPVIVNVSGFEVGHNEAGVGLGYFVPRIFVSIVVDAKRSGEVIISPREFRSDKVGGEYSEFVTSNKERSEIYSSAAFGALMNALDSVIQEIAATLAEDPVSDCK